MIDIETQDAAVQARLRVIVTAAATIDSADSLEEVMRRTSFNSPALFTIWADNSSSGRRVANLKSQIEEPVLRIGQVTKNYLPNGTGALKGPKGAYQICQLVKKALVGFKVPAALTPLIFVSTELVDRHGGLVFIEHEFRTSWEETYL